jgi:hypothetical protein
MENIFFRDLPPMVTKSRKSQKARHKYLYDMFTPDVCAKIAQEVCTSSVYLEACQWVSGKKRSYCRKRTKRTKL